MKKYVAVLAFIIGAMALVADANAGEGFCYGELKEFGALYELSTSEAREALKNQVEARWRAADFLSEEQIKASYLAIMADWIDQGNREVRGILIGCYNEFGE